MSLTDASGPSLIIGARIGKRGRHIATDRRRTSDNNYCVFAARNQKRAQNKERQKTCKHALLAER
jgi:hypothetical protein